MGDGLGFADGLGDDSEGLDDSASFGEELGCADSLVDCRAEGIDDWALVGEELGFADGLCESCCADEFGDGIAEGLNDVAPDGC